MSINNSLSLIKLETLSPKKLELFWKSSEVSDPLWKGFPYPFQPPIKLQKKLDIVNPMHGDPTWENATGRY